MYSLDKTVITIYFFIEYFCMTSKDYLQRDQYLLSRKFPRPSFYDITRAFRLPFQKLMY